MRNLLIVCFILSLLSVARADFSQRVKAYIVNAGVSLESLDYDGNGDKSILITKSNQEDYKIKIWRIQGVPEPLPSDLPSDAEAQLILDELKQSRKSLLHKSADNALIAVLVRGGLVPVGTTKLTDGSESSIAMTLLQMEILDPDNADLQKLSTKLDRIKSIIKAEGGSPDDAQIHVLTP